MHHVTAAENFQFRITSTQDKIVT